MEREEQNEFNSNQESSIFVHTNDDRDSFDSDQESSVFVHNERENMNQIIIRSNLSISTDYPRIWKQYNQNAQEFEDIFGEKSEQEMLKSIFLETNEIAKLLDIEYSQLPIGIFCSTSEDLKKLELFMNSIKCHLEKEVKQTKKGTKKLTCFSWCK